MSHDFRDYNTAVQDLLAHDVWRRLGEKGRVKNGELRSDLDVAHTAELVWLLHFTLIRELFVAPWPGRRGDEEALLSAAVALVVAGLKEA